MTKREIKRIFKAEKIQLNKMARDLIYEDLKRRVIKTAQRCKQGNIKRLTPELLYLVK